MADLLVFEEVAIAVPAPIGAPVLFCALPYTSASFSNISCRDVGINFPQLPPPPCSWVTHLAHILIDYRSLCTGLYKLGSLSTWYALLSPTGDAIPQVVEGKFAP